MAILFCRTTIIFLTLMVFMRILGKRQMGELELSELVVSILIADIGTLPLQDIGMPLINCLVPIITLFSLELLLSGLTLRFMRLRPIFFGKPCFLIRKGVIDQQEMQRNNLSLDELLSELRSQSVTDISVVEYAVLETDGTLNVLLTPSDRPATAGQMGVAPPSTGYTSALIVQGRVLSENLRSCGRDERWLRQELKRQGFSQPRDVYLMTLNEAGQVFCAGKDRE